MCDYLEMSDPEYVKIENGIFASYKNACIVWIEKIENKFMEEAYDNYKNTVAKRNGDANEKRLFHGTGEEMARKIIRQGFRPDLAKVCAHGDGVYFSKFASYSKNYSIMKSKKGEEILFMLICDVITGNVGQAFGKIPKQFDSVTDSLCKPSMYIVDKSEACIPRFLVAFYPNAK